MASWPRKRLRLHLESLAEMHDVEIHWVSKTSKCEASIGSREVWIVKPSKMERYLVALHEFGHIVHPEARRMWPYRTNTSRVLACEAIAWGWAIDNAHPIVRDKINRELLELIGSEYLMSHVD